MKPDNETINRHSDKADSTQPIAALVEGKHIETLSKLRDAAYPLRCFNNYYEQWAALDTILNDHAALTQQVADLKAEVARLREALEFIGDHLEGEMGLLSADDYDPEFGTNETVILAFNKAMEALQSGRRIQVWQD
jgi:hypothetical protein